MSEKFGELLPYLTDVGTRHAKLITFSPSSARIAEDVCRAGTISDTENDELGLKAYLSNTNLQATDRLEFTLIAPGSSGQFVDLNVCNKISHPPSHSDSPHGHSRACFGSIVPHDERKFSFLRGQVGSGSVTDGPVMPIFLVDIDSASAATLGPAINAIFGSDDKMLKAERSITPPLVLLYEGRWSRENDVPKILLDSLATLADILNWNRYDRQHAIQTQTHATVLMLTTSTPDSQDIAIREFIRQVIGSREKLNSLLQNLNSASRSSTRHEVAAASITKVVLEESGEYRIETIDSADTPYEDIQRRLLNTESDPTRYIDEIMLDFGWMTGSFLESLPMRQGFVESALRGFIVKSLSDLEDPTAHTIGLNELILSFIRAMVRYGPLGFTTTERFEWRNEPNTEICDHLLAVSQRTTDPDLKTMLQSQSGLNWMNDQKRRLRDLEQNSKSPLNRIDDPRKFVQIELLRKILTVVTNDEQWGRI